MRKLLCRLRIHDWETLRGRTLPSRRCRRCRLRQSQVAGRWLALKS